VIWNAADIARLYFCAVSIPCS